MAEVVINWGKMEGTLDQRLINLAPTHSKKSNDDNVICKYCDNHRLVDVFRIDFWFGMICISCS